MSVASYFMYHYAPWRKDMSGEIKPHCMGMEFPKRDTDGKVKWVPTAGPQDGIHLDIETFTEWYIRPAVRHFLGDCYDALPSAAHLDAIAEEQRVKEKTSAQVPNR